MMRLTAFQWVPPFAQGLARDMRVRWALEEAGLAYDVRPIGPDALGESSYRRQQPFGQVPVLEDGNLVLFESGAILLYLGERSAALLPRQTEARMRATSWLFGALNSVEIAIMQLAEIDLFHGDEDWAKGRRPGAEAFVRQRLSDVSASLGERAYLDDRFTVGDLMMASVLDILRHTEIVADYPNVRLYLDRCKSRPAYRRALADHMAVFRAFEAGQARAGTG